MIVVLGPRIPRNEEELIEAFEEACAVMGADVEDLGPIFSYTNREPEPLLPSPQVDAWVEASVTSRPRHIPLLDAGDNRFLIDRGLAPLGCRWSGAVILATWERGLHPCEGCDVDCDRRALPTAIDATKEFLSTAGVVGVRHG